MAVEIKISELRIIINRILNKLERSSGKGSFVVESTDYWDVLDNERYEPREPSTYGVGNLRDDWDFLKPILEDENLAVPLALIHVSSILHRLGLHSQPVQE